MTMLWKLVLAVLGAGIEIIHAEELEKGPDWDTDENYNVFTIIIYLSDSKGSNSSLAFIPNIS